MTIFHHLQFRATLTTILHTSQNPHVLRISGFPKIDTARRRERTSEMDLVAAPFRAGEMHFFDLDHNFSPRGSPKNPHASAHTTDLHQMLFSYRKNPIVWPHCLGKKGLDTPVHPWPVHVTYEELPQREVNNRFLEKWRKITISLLIVHFRKMLFDI